MKLEFVTKRPSWFRRKGPWPRYIAKGDKDIARSDNLRVPLSERQGNIVLAMLGRKYVDSDLLMEILWDDPDDMPLDCENVKDVVLCKLRHKLIPLGYTIAFCGCAAEGRKWHWSYSLEKIEQKELKRELKQAA